MFYGFLSFIDVPCNSSVLHYIKYVLQHQRNTERGIPMKRFKVGKTYATRSACDHDCIFSFTILGRTAKTVTVDVHGKTVRRGLALDYDGSECFKPFGTYSMCAVIRASKEID